MGYQLTKSDFTEADLLDTDFSNADISESKFYKVRNLSVEQIKKAKNYSLAFFDEDFQQQLQDT